MLELNTQNMNRVRFERAKVSCKLRSRRNAVAIWNSFHLILFRSFYANTSHGFIDLLGIRQMSIRYRFLILYFDHASNKIMLLQNV